MKRILTIDGGGVRGVIPAVVLEELEQRLGKSVVSSFDLISGTSVGGIIACSLAAGHSAETVRKLIENRSHDIFKQRIFSGFSLVRSRYSNRYLRDMLTEYLGDRLLSSSNIEILVPAYNLTKSMPYYFNRHSSRLGESMDFKLVDVAVATASAPIYFTPSKITSLSGEEHVFIDGGVFANNPTGLAFAQARFLWPEDTYEIVSIGTGHQEVEMNVFRKYWGAMAWLRPLVGIIFDGISDSVEDQLKSVPSVDCYDRFQAKINIPLDDISKSAVRKLNLAGKGICVREDFANLVYRLSS